jgi:hypothetical protein
MALLTAVTKLTIVNVIGAMACNAGGAKFRGIHIFWCGLPVATLACHFAVRAIEPVTRPAVVVKVPNGPCTGVVTRFTAHSKFLNMFVLILVT